jgi:hypothetical protein
MPTDIQTSHSLRENLRAYRSSPAQIARLEALIARPIRDSEAVKPLEFVNAGYVGQYMLLVEVDDLLTQAQQTNACERA